MANFSADVDEALLTNEIESGQNNFEDVELNSYGTFGSLIDAQSAKGVLQDALICRAEEEFPGSVYVTGSRMSLLPGLLIIQILQFLRKPALIIASAVCRRFLILSVCCH
jgi:hypothetical protein